MFDFLGVLTNPLIALGVVVGTALGFAAAYALHVLFPFHDLVLLQALLVALGCLGGVLVGSAAEKRWGGE